MKEKLAIKSDRVDAWQKKKVNRLKGDLAPRKTEATKSAWAHVLDDGIAMSELLSCRPDACRELQALALFIFKEKSDSSKNVRENIEGVSVHRMTFAPGDVNEDPADHPVNGYQASHRSLDTQDREKLERYAGQIVQEELFECWIYHISELRVKLQFLVDQGEIREDFQPAAQQLLVRWTRILTAGSDS